MSYLDKTFCASPGCKNECGRQMTHDEKELLKEMAFKGLAVSKFISYGYFCGNKENSRKII